MTRLLVVIGYLVLLAVLGMLARCRSRRGHVDFFLAGRSVGPLLLFSTMAATNFSAFTVIGFAGEGYRTGYAHYPIMAFGTGLAALSFLLIGVPAWQAARRVGAVTPPELILHRFGNRVLHGLFLGVMTVFTLPYLATQPMAAGIALERLLGVPYMAGATLVVLIGAGYLLLAGMRGDVWTDALQLWVMVMTMVVLFIWIARLLGGFGVANISVFRQAPQLFGRPGGAGRFTPGVWFSYMVLWSLCNPMFPQLFQRFMAAKSERALGLTAAFYPVITGTLFFMPVAIGVLGRLLEQGLTGKAADEILPLAVSRLLPDWAGAIAIAGVLAALMSTMDSQLLTLSSMVVRDGRLLTGRVPEGHFSWERLSIVGLALVGLVIALRPATTILDLLTYTTFSGLAVLFPTTLAAAYWRRANPWAAVASIATGETVVLLCHFRLLPSFGFLSAIPAVVIAGLVLVLGSFIWPARGLEPWTTIPRGCWWIVLMFGALVLAGNDFWNWRNASPLWLGLPGWLWYFFVLQLVLVVGVGVLVSKRQPSPQ